MDSGRPGLSSRPCCARTPKRLSKLCDHLHVRQHSWPVMREYVLLMQNMGYRYNNQEEPLRDKVARIG